MNKLQLVEVSMVRSGDNHQFFIITCQLFESILTEITRMGIFTMNHYMIALIY